MGDGDAAQLCDPPNRPSSDPARDHQLPRVRRCVGAGDLLGEEPKLRFAEIVEKACAAVMELDDLGRVVHCSFGDFPAHGYLWQTNMFRGLRAHDIAKVIGIDFEVPDAMVEGIWEEISPQAEEWRAIGVFPAAVGVPDDAPLLDRLLGLTGRTASGRHHLRRGRSRTC